MLQWCVARRPIFSRGVFCFPFQKQVGVANIPTADSCFDNQPTLSFRALTAHPLEPHERYDGITESAALRRTPKGVSCVCNNVYPVPCRTLVQGKMIEMFDPETKGNGYTGTLQGTNIACLCGCAATISGTTSRRFRILLAIRSSSCVAGFLLGSGMAL